MPTRNDPRCPPEGQGEPACRSFHLKARSPSAGAANASSETGVGRADAAAFVVSNRDPAAALAALPHADLWRTLYARADRHSKTPLLVSRLPNSRHTLAVVGFLPGGASAFERLELAGRLMRALVEPGVASLQCHAGGFDAEDSARGARGARERRAGRRGADAAAQVEAGPARRAALDRRPRRPPARSRRRRRDRCRQPPRALAHHPAAQRARLRRLPTRPATPRAARRLVVPLLRRARARAARRRRLPRRDARQRPPRRRHRAALLPPGRGTPRAAHRARRQGHLLRHRRHQPQGAQGHVPDARRHAGQRRGRRHAARARAQRAPRSRSTAGSRSPRTRSARAPTARRRSCRR